MYFSYFLFLVPFLDILGEAEVIPGHGLVPRRDLVLDRVPGLRITASRETTQDASLAIDATDKRLMLKGSYVTSEKPDMVHIARVSILNQTKRMTNQLTLASVSSRTSWPFNEMHQDTNP